MLNKVTIEGDIVRSIWGKSGPTGYFVSIKQERTFNKFTMTSYFSLYANHPLADTLASIVEKHPNAHIVIDGRLKTYYSKKNQDWKTNILIDKIIDWSPNDQPKVETKIEPKVEAKAKTVTKTEAKTDTNTKTKK